MKKKNNKYNNTSSTYWKKLDGINGFSVPNETLFRLIGNMKFKYKNKKVLDIGMGQGSNLLEFKRRGSRIFGMDIRKKKIFNFCKKHNLPRKNFYVCDLNSHFPKMNSKYDLIVCKDTFYYFNKNRHLSFFKFCRQLLKKKGYFIFQFIQAELRETRRKDFFDYSLSNHLKKEKNYHERNNPVSFFKSNYVKKIIKETNFKLHNNIFDISFHSKKRRYITISRYLVLTQ